MQAGMDTMRACTIAALVVHAAMSVSAQDLSTNIKVCGTAHNCVRCRVFSKVPRLLRFQPFITHRQVYEYGTTNVVCT